MVRRTTGSSSHRSVHVTRSIRSRPEDRDSRSEQRRSRREAANSAYDEQRSSRAPQQPSRRQEYYEQPRQDNRYEEAAPRDTQTGTPDTAFGVSRPRGQYPAQEAGASARMRQEPSGEYEPPVQEPAEPVEAEEVPDAALQGEESEMPPESVTLEPEFEEEEPASFGLRRPSSGGAAGNAPSSVAAGASVFASRPQEDASGEAKDERYEEEPPKKRGFFGRRRDEDYEDEIEQPEEEAEEEYEEEPPKKRGFFGRRRRDEDYEDEIEQPEEEAEEEYAEEPPKKRGFFGRRRDEDYEDEIEQPEEEAEEEYEEEPPKKRGFFGRRRRDEDYEDEIDQPEEEAEEEYEEEPSKKHGFFGRRRDEDEYAAADAGDDGNDDGYDDEYEDDGGSGRNRSIIWIIVIIIALLGTLAAMGYYFREDILDMIAEIQQRGQIAATATPLATLVPTPEPTLEPTLEPTATPEPVATTDPNTISVSFVGDLTAYQLQLDDAHDEATDTYDFTHNFADIAPYLSAADLTIGDLATTVSGSELTYTGQPKFNSPESFLSAMSAAGMDVLITANSRAFDQGWVGVTKTLQNIENAGMKAAGTYLSKEDYYEPLIVEVKGVKIAILAYTDEPEYADEMSQDKLNFCYKSINMNTVKKDVAAAKEKGAQIILASVHWGSEDKRTPTDKMQEYAQDMMEMGVDVVFGTHPQMLQKVTRKTVTVEGADKESLVAYSLGNFLSSRRNQYNDSGMILTVNFTKNDDGTVTMGDASYLPTWVCVNETDVAADKDFRILPVGKYVDDENLLGTLDAKAQTRIKQIWDETTGTVGDAITAVRQ